MPVNFYNLRKPYRDMALVAIAGPFSNFVLAAFFFFWERLLVEKTGLWEAGSLGHDILHKAVYFNLLLAAFNLLPIPPLDGSRILTWLLPAGLRESYIRLESFGIFLVIFAIYAVPPVQTLLLQTMNLMYRGIDRIVTVGGVW